jgi:hypothetical protein
MPELLSNEEVDRRLGNSPIKRLGDYINCYTKIEFTCVKRNHTWFASPSKVLIKQSCHQCISNEKMDKKLEASPIRRLGNYVNINTEIEFTCVKNGHTWLAKPNTALSSKGCRQCAFDSYRLTEDEVKAKLKGRTIRLIGQYTSGKYKTEFECEVDGHRWMARPFDIFSGGGCPSCSNHLPLTNASFDAKLLEKNILVLRIDDIVDSRTIAEFECKRCQNRWFAKPNDILQSSNIRYKYFGCKVCRNRDRIDEYNEIIDNNVRGKLIRLSSYTAATDPLDLQCLRCEFKWTTTYDNIVHSESGCPKCRLKNQKIVEDLLHLHFSEFEITSNYRLKESKTHYQRGLIIDFLLCKVGIQIFVEYNGQQHYKPTRFGGITQSVADANFDRQQKRDSWLRTFCKDNGIYLLEVPYFLSVGKIEKLLIDSKKIFLPHVLGSDHLSD